MNARSLKENMTKALVSVRWDAPIRVARDLMVERGIRHLPVLGENGTLVGILSDRDLRRALDPDFRLPPHEALVADFMTWPVITVDINTPLVKAVERMIDEKISALVITRGVEERMGIITSGDMLNVLHELLREDSGRKHSLVDLSYEPLWREVMRTASSVGI